MNNEEYDAILEDIVNEMDGGELLQIPGVYEALKDSDLNEEVIRRWKANN